MHKHHNKLHKYNIQKAILQYPLNYSKFLKKIFSHLNRWTHNQPNQLQRRRRDRPGRHQGVCQGLQAAPALARPHTDPSRPSPVRYRGTGLQPKCHLQVNVPWKFHSFFYSFPTNQPTRHSIRLLIRSKVSIPVSLFYAFTPLLTRPRATLVICILFVVLILIKSPQGSQITGCE